MQITLIRHLPTAWNKEALLQGRKDISICDISRYHLKGMEKNKRLLEEQSPYDLVLASSLRRTYQTAKLYHYEPVAEALLDELDFGEYEGRPRKKMLRHFGEQWFEAPETIVLGESLLTLQGRIIAFLEKYKTYQNILLFGHGAWIRAFLSYIQKGTISDMNNIKVHCNDRIIVKINSFVEKSSQRG